MNKHNLDKTILVRLPEPLLNEFKQACYANYKSISEAIRDMIQEYIKSEHKNRDL